MRWPYRPERATGAVTAEFAVAVPAVVLVLAACLGGLRVGTEQLRLTAAAALAARSAARADPDGAAAAIGRNAGASTVVLARADGLVCATARAAVPLLGLPVPISARSCALLPAEP